jgi:exosortase
MTLAESIQRYRIHLLLALLLLAGLYSTIVPGMVMQWYQDDNYSHGFLVPVIAGYFLFQRWDHLKATRVTPSNLGLAVILFALAQLTVAWLGMEYFTLRSSLVVLIAGMVIWFFGTEVFKSARLPILYLFFMVPLPYIVYDALAFPLKLFVTKASVWSMKMIGITVLREGNIIMFPSTTLEVADACSGIRSLVSLLALAVAYAFFINISPLKRWIIIFSAIPIAIFTNAMRVIGTGILAQHWGAKAAEGFFHEFAGLAVFALAMVMLVGLGAILKTRDQGPETRD